jgi:hypothetical protein
MRNLAQEKSPDAGSRFPIKDQSERSIFMNQKPPSGSCTRRWRRWGPPAAATGVAGTSLAIWFEEVAAFVTEFIGVILLPVLAGVIFLFNHYIFKSATPKANDIKKDRSN